MKGCLLLSAFLLLLPAVAQAHVIYARQTQAACRLCHHQDLQRLTKYGRMFRLNGYRETPEMLRMCRSLQAGKPENVPPSAGDKPDVDD